MGKCIGEGEWVYAARPACQAHELAEEGLGVSFAHQLYCIGAGEGTK
jgi:hypothetical protein